MLENRYFSVLQQKVENPSLSFLQKNREKSNFDTYRLLSKESVINKVLTIGIGLIVASTAEQNVVLLVDDHGPLVCVADCNCVSVRSVDDWGLSGVDCQGVGIHPRVVNFRDKGVSVELHVLSSNSSVQS